MKKFVLSLMVFAAVTACKKESSVTENTEIYTEDSVTVAESNKTSEVVIPFKKIELSPEETSKILAKQNNDTLYVTNFFATWCGPCMREMPHFKEKIKEVEGQPVKFTFVGLDPRADWDTKVKAFAEENNLSKYIVLVDGEKLAPEFFHLIFIIFEGYLIWKNDYPKRGRENFTG